MITNLSLVMDLLFDLADDEVNKIIRFLMTKQDEILARPLVNDFAQFVTVTLFFKPKVSKLRLINNYFLGPKT